MKISRRTIARQLGLFLGGASILGSGVARALVKTPAQTAGPFYPPEPHGETDIDLTLLEGHSERAAGDVILVRGRITDTDGNPLANARVDIWQANHYGRYDHPDDSNPAPLDPNFQGIGVTRTDVDGRYGFKTIRPAPYPIGRTASRPAHIHFKISHEDKRGVTTQMYFEGDPLIEGDSVMAGTPEEQRHLLISRTDTDADTGLPLHRFDVALA